jgi:CelD/BcsL family acetyltransferase involved in cellulose biosynthesis
VRVEFADTVRPVTALRATILTDFTDVEALHEDWERLWRCDPMRHVFLSFLWARAWWRAHGARHELCVIVVCDERQTVGILPLVREGTLLHFLGSPDSDYTDILCEESRRIDVVAAAFGVLLHAEPSWSRCRIDNLPESSRIARSIGQLPERLRKRLGVLPKASCPAIVSATPDGQVFRTLARKDSIRRHDRKLEKLGEIRFRHLETREEIHAHLPTFIRQHIARRAMAGDRSLLLSGDAVAFYRALADELDPRHELRFSVLEAGGTPLAYHMGFETAGRFIWYKPTFDIDRWDWSPGEVLLGRLLKDVAARELTEFDFTLGDEAFKYRFANVVRPLFELRIYPPGLRGSIVRARDAARQRLKQWPAVYRSLANAVTAARQILTRARGGPLSCTFRTLIRSVWIRDEFLIFRRCATPAAEGPELEPAALSDLALLGTLDPESLRDARARLREGARCYITRCGELPHIVRAVESERLTTADFEVPLPGPGTVLTDVHPGIVRAEAGHQTTLWTWRRADDREFRRAANAAGFRLFARVLCFKIFGRGTVRHTLCGD